MGGAQARTHDLGTHLKFLVWTWLQEPRNRVFIAICATVLIIVLISCFCFHFVRSLTKYEYSGTRHWHTRRERIRDRITDAFFQELSHHALLTSVAQPCHTHFHRGHDRTVDGCPTDGQADSEEGSVHNVAPPPSYQEAMSVTIDQPTDNQEESQASRTANEEDSRTRDTHDIDLEPPPSYDSVSHITSRELVPLPSSAPNSPHVLC